MSINDEQQPVKVIVHGQYMLKQGDLFKSYEDLRQRMDNHSKESFVYYWLRDSRTVEGACKKASRPIQKRLKYYSVKYACIFGGQRFYPRGNGRRNMQSIRNNCKAYVLLRASKCGNYLEVISVCNEHNHEVSEDVSKSLSQNRKPSPEIRDEIQQMILFKIDRDTIIDYVRLKYQKTLIKKDLFNLGARTKRLYANYPYDANLAKEMKKHMTDYIRDHKSDLSDNDMSVECQVEYTHPNDERIKLEIEEPVDTRDYEMGYDEYAAYNKEGVVDDLIEYLSDNGDDEVGNDVQDDENDVNSSMDEYCDNAYELTADEQNSVECTNAFNDGNTIVLEVYHPNEVSSNELCNNDLADTQALLAVLDDNSEEESDIQTNEFVVEEIIEVVPENTETVALSATNKNECDICGRDLSFLQKQIHGLEQYYNKLKEETRILELKRNKLKFEMTQLE